MLVGTSKIEYKLDFTPENSYKPIEQHHFTGKAIRTPLLEALSGVSGSEVPVPISSSQPVYFF